MKKRVQQRGKKFYHQKYWFIFRWRDISISNEGGKSHTIWFSSLSDAWAYLSPRSGVEVTNHYQNEKLTATSYDSTIQG